jgi:hypothetical protein
MIRSIAEAGRSRYVARVLVGEVPADLFEYALVLSDGSTNSGLHLNGHTQITGDVALVAEGRGLDSLTTLDSEGFNGRLNGDVFTFETLAVHLDAFLFQQTIAHSEAVLSGKVGSPDPLAGSYSPRALARRLPYILV